MGPGDPAACGVHLTRGSPGPRRGASGQSGGGGGANAQQRALESLSRGTPPRPGYPLSSQGASQPASF